MSIEIGLLDKCLERYGSRHYLFRVLDHNGLQLPTEFQGGEVVEFPPRAANAKMAEAKSRREKATYQPV